MTEMTHHHGTGPRGRQMPPRRHRKIYDGGGLYSTQRPPSAAHRKHGNTRMPISLLGLSSLLVSWSCYRCQHAFGGGTHTSESQFPAARASAQYVKHRRACVTKASRTMEGVPPPLDPCSLLPPSSYPGTKPQSTISPTRFMHSDDSVMLAIIQFFCSFII